MDMSASPFANADARIRSTASQALCSCACFSDSTSNGILSCLITARAKILNAVLCTHKSLTALIVILLIIWRLYVQKKFTKEFDLHQFVAFVEIPDAELGVGSAAIVVLYDRVADVDRIAGLDVIEEVGHIEGNRRDMVIRM